MNNPLVSIIIPTFNRCDFLKETLKSIDIQEYTNWECIIVDDGSTDETEEFMKILILKNPKYKFYKRPNDYTKGANGCRNYGLTLSTGTYVNWFDDDDIMLPNFISSKVFTLKEFNYDFIINTGCFTNEKLETRKKIEFFNTENLYRDYFFWNLKILTPSVLFKKQFLELNNYIFDVTLTTSHEFDFFCKIFNKVQKTQYKILNDVTFLYRGHENSTTSKNQKYNRSFKESEVVAVERNFKLSNNDSVVYQSVYRLLINQLIKASKYKHQKNIDFIKESISKNIKKNFWIVKVSIWLLIIAPSVSKFVFFDKLVKKTPII